MIPHVTFAGYSGSGKTTLTIKVIKYLSDRGYKVAAMKHDGHNFEMDKEGKDTFRMKQAGAVAVSIASSSKYALIADSSHRLSFSELMAIMPKDADIIIGEGFKDEDIPKILVHRRANDKPNLYAKEKGIIAVATDIPEEFENAENIFDINDCEGIALFIENRVMKK